MNRRPSLVALIAIGVIAAPASGTPAASQRPTFGAVAEAVTVDVLVRKGNTPVVGLSPSDFALSDNGVPQTLADVSVEALPLDLTLILDMSGSVEVMLKELKNEVREAAAALHPNDRVRLITFSEDVHEEFGWQPAGSTLPLDQLTVGGATTVYDALGAALMRTRENDRRQLLVAFTDGFDTNSVLQAETVRALADRSDAVLRLFVDSTIIDPRQFPRPREDTRGYWLLRTSPPDGVFNRTMEVLEGAATATGGRLDRMWAGAHIPVDLHRALLDFRSSYVLRYRPTGVTPNGWHELSVKVRRSGSFTVEARKGYFGG